MNLEKLFNLIDFANLEKVGVVIGILAGVATLCVRIFALRKKRRKNFDAIVFAEKLDEIREAVLALFDTRELVVRKNGIMVEKVVDLDSATQIAAASLKNYFSSLMVELRKQRLPNRSFKILEHTEDLAESYISLKRTGPSKMPDDLWKNLFVSEFSEVLSEIKELGAEADQLNHI